MDQHGQIGPEKGTYAADAREVARRLLNGAPVYVAVAHRMTRIDLILIRAEHLSAPGQMPSQITGHDGEWLYVSWIEHGSGWFDISTYLAPDYVAESLNASPVDGETIAEFLTRLNFNPPVRAA